MTDCKTKGAKGASKSDSEYSDDDDDEDDSKPGAEDSDVGDDDDDGHSDSSFNLIYRSHLESSRARKMAASHGGESNAKRKCGGTRKPHTYAFAAARRKKADVSGDGSGAKRGDGEMVDLTFDSSDGDEHTGSTVSGRDSASLGASGADGKPEWVQKEPWPCQGSQYFKGKDVKATVEERSVCNQNLPTLLINEEMGIGAGTDGMKVRFFNGGSGGMCSNKSICRVTCVDGCKWKCKVERLVWHQLTPSVTGVHDAEAHRRRRKKKSSKTGSSVKRRYSAARGGNTSGTAIANEANRSLVEYMVNVRRTRLDRDPNDRIGMSFGRAIKSVCQVRYRI